jgi:hypothetical protein
VQILIQKSALKVSHQLILMVSCNFREARKTKTNGYYKKIMSSGAEKSGQSSEAPDPYENLSDPEQYYM